ncbi:hypothetical protein Ahy_Scaffold6g107995 [Arachis hypogaea]|uniref:Aminotransferase-like plant mobile domain-containing protein n=1 Tax=Arachis hypogaea TaxID=3818 RepID=A0A444WP36_ARAHY|nr:hypothetical protein Ahy_Scaffold6g107995 [Arachis hypogaea]
MPSTDDPETLRQYARCNIMLLIGGYLLTDKSNNLVHVHWLPLLRDFAECRALSRGSDVLAWTYQSLCLVAQQDVTNITGCTPLLMSSIYQRFSQWCPPDRRIYQYPLAARVYDDHVMQALCSHWFREEEEWGTWLSAIPLVCFNIVRFHHVDRVKRQFNGEQQVPGTPVNLDRYEWLIIF